MRLKWITRILTGLLVLVLLIGVAAYFYLKHTTDSFMLTNTNKR